MEAFNLYTAQFVQKSMFVLYLKVFLMDSWDLNKHDKQIEFPGQAEQGILFHLSTFSDNMSELVPLDYFSEVSCLRIRGNCFFWVFYQTRCLGMVIFLKSFLWQPVTILGELFPYGKLSQTSGIIRLIKLFYVYSRRSRWKRMFDRTCGISFCG